MARPRHAPKHRTRRIRPYATPTTYKFNNPLFASGRQPIRSHRKVMQVSCQFLWSRGLLGSASIASWFRSGVQYREEGKRGVEIRIFKTKKVYMNPNKREYNLFKQRVVEYEISQSSKTCWGWGGGKFQYTLKSKQVQIVRECTKMQDKWTNQRSKKKKRKKRSWQSDRDELI